MALDSQSSEGTIRMQSSSRAVAFGLLVGLLAACGDDNVPGREGERCVSNEQCATDLVCRTGAGGSLTCSVRLPECSSCVSDTECLQVLQCVRFSDGSNRCGSGLGATTCRTP